ncbi:MAG TPA: hypothetical protein VIJ88_03050, partial [Candidatus Paceibacterota bacterium]
MEDVTMKLFWFVPREVDWKPSCICIAADDEPEAKRLLKEAEVQDPEAFFVPAEKYEISDFTVLNGNKGLIAHFLSLGPAWNNFRIYTSPGSGDVNEEPL